MEFPFKKQIVGLLGAKANMSASPTESKGAPGFANYNGFIEEKEKNAQLAGRQKYRTFSNILANTIVVAASVRYFLNLLSKANWSVSPAEDTPAAEEMAEFVEQVIHDMDTPFGKVIKKQGMYKFYGNAVQEWTAKRRDDGRLGLLDIRSRPSHTIERWDTDDQGKVLGVVQRSPQDHQEIYIPREKLVYSVDDALTDSPEGLGILRNVVEANNRLQRYEQLEGWGFETDLRGVPIGRAPLVELAKTVKRGELTQQQADSIIKPLRNFVSNHIKNPKLGMMIDSSVYRSEDTQASPSSGAPQWSVELLSSESRTQAEVDTTINRLNHEIAMTIGTEHLLLGRDGRGTQALSRDKSTNFFLIIDSTLSELAEAFNKDIIDTLWELNGLDNDLKPSFATEAVQFRNIEEITGAIKDLAQSGDILMPDDPIINEVRELLGLSKKDMDQVMRSAMLDAGLNNGRQTAQPSGRENVDDVRDLEENNDE